MLCCVCVGVCVQGYVNSSVFICVFVDRLEVNISCFLWLLFTLFYYLRHIKNNPDPPIRKQLSWMSLLHKKKRYTSSQPTLFHTQTQTQPLGLSEPRAQHYSLAYQWTPRTALVRSSTVLGLHKWVQFWIVLCSGYPDTVLHAGDWAISPGSFLLLVLTIKNTVLIVTF